MPKAPPLLEVDRLALVAGGVTLGTGISFRLEPGERVAVVGPSGSGKTTLLRAVCGLDALVPGATVRLQGKTPAAWGWPAYRRRVVLVEQKPILLEGTLEENLRRPFRYHSAQGALFPVDRAATLLDRLGLGTARREQAAHTLSVGQQQRASLLRALLLTPDVLLLDEPTSALDPDSAELVEDLLREECEVRGLALLIVTHNSQQSSEWCHRALHLRDFSPDTEAVAS